MQEPGNKEEFAAIRQLNLGDRSQSLTWLIVAAIATAVLWQIPWGNYILYPFTILATWFHEMSHGLTAQVLGGRFDQLQIFADGSGFARYAIPYSFDPIRRALIAAAGPMGPPIAGATLIVASRSHRAANLSLKILGSLLLLSVIIWVRSLLGLILIPLLGIAILAIAFKGSNWLKNFTVQFLGVQACVSTYHQLNYLFSYSAGSLGLSDTAQIQQQLFLPYWFWGGFMAIMSLLLLIQSLRITYMSK
ncbi:M50 family metallopeptidase [Calothrix sp. 336/3]|uniref:M50 family metallopeptidase n=1 Tax=Calothrix sp. 336/3 TaxID=1337936 RepID=UPI0004E32856|nr:M50 family metallopeptidase [Calothrix sp. 336/3]AKG20211.1 peptidase M50 [Calothrix sp. 336/3]